MAEVVVVDTDILIDFGRGFGYAATHLDTIAQQFTLSISAVTQMELIIGCRNKADQNRLDTFFAPVSDIAGGRTDLCDSCGPSAQIPLESWSSDR
jgi:hypothetical protein